MTLIVDRHVTIQERRFACLQIGVVFVFVGQRIRDDTDQTSRQEAPVALQAVTQIE